MFVFGACLSIDCIWVVIENPLSIKKKVYLRENTWWLSFYVSVGIFRVLYVSLRGHNPLQKKSNCGGHLYPVFITKGNKSVVFCTRYYGDSLFNLLFQPGVLIGIRLRLKQKVQSEIAIVFILHLVEIAAFVGIYSAKQGYVTRDQHLHYPSVRKSRCYFIFIFLMEKKKDC